jgi:N-hydroxyarylamine O-acetyltransferase
MNTERYVTRIGVDPADVRSLDRETLTGLQKAHVRTVPFENLAIAGDPWHRRSGSGVSLDIADLEAKVVARERGGFCYELNGLFTELLAELGFEATRNAGRIVGDGGIELPANHLVPTVELDRTYVTDVGMGTPKIRRPVPLDGTPIEDDVGNTWRVVETDRPDVDYTVQYRSPDEDSWTDRYVFTRESRPMRYFTATCDYLTSAPESVFTGSTVATIGTESGHLKLSGRELRRTEGGEETVRTLDREEWDDTLETEFGIEW